MKKHKDCYMCLCKHVLQKQTPPLPEGMVVEFRAEQGATELVLWYDKKGLG